MAINKVIDRNNNVLIDLTTDTVNPNKVLVGEKFHGADGKEYYGTIQPNELDSLKYTFIDYTGEILYEFTDEEIDAMTSLPEPPTYYASENLEFQEWNWTLEELKSVDRNRPDRPIVGATVITADRKTYINIDTTLLNNSSIRLNFESLSSMSSSYKATFDIDWGDGNIESFVDQKTTYFDHTYSDKGEYTIVIDLKNFNDYTISNGGYLYFTFHSNMNSFNSIRNIKNGNIMVGFGTIGGQGYHNRTENINYPLIPIFETVKDSVLTALLNSFITYMPVIKGIVIPNINKYFNGTAGCAGDFLTNKYVGGIVSLPNILHFNTLGCGTFISKVKRIYLSSNSTYNGFVNVPMTTYLPNTVTKVNFNAGNFTPTGGIEYFTLPESITEIMNSCFYYASSLKVIDLSKSKLTTTPTNSNTFNNGIMLERIIFPNTLVSLNSINAGYGAIIDLSNVDHLITLTGSPFSSENKNPILIKSELLDQYKSASYWSNYASQMIGV